MAQQWVEGWTANQLARVRIPANTNGFYAILCVKFVREVRYFTSKVAIFSLSTLVVRKVTGR